MDYSLIAAFITGLTTGGLSCMLVQGGLLTTSLASRIEAEFSASASEKNKNARTKAPARRPELALPIALFLVAKIVAYTLLGFLLGGLGSVFSLTPVMRGVLQAAIGIFMVGNGLRMFNVHPIFRFFNFEPPSSLTRWLRRRSKNQSSAFTPVMLGALTVLIPCGVTQSMMALAVGSANPLVGAALMFAFTLGTTPVFFGLTYLATRLGSLLEKNMTRVAAVALLVLGVWTFDTGLNLMGSPISLSRSVTSLFNPQSETLQTYSAPGVDSGFDAQNALPMSDDVINIEAKDNGYSPSKVLAPADKEITLNLVTKGTYSCSRAFTIPALDLNAILPAEGIETLTIPPQKAGTKLQFTCSMGMFGGTIVFQ